MLDLCNRLIERAVLEIDPSSAHRSIDCCADDQCIFPELTVDHAYHKLAQRCSDWSGTINLSLVIDQNGKQIHLCIFQIVLASFASIYSTHIFILGYIGLGKVSLGYRVG